MINTGTRNASVPAAIADHSIPPRPSMVVAVLLSSLMFAAAHYVGQYGDPVDWADSRFWFGFIFRCVAGVFFSVLFIYRGFGIAAGTHAGYDILVGLS